MRNRVWKTIYIGANDESSRLRSAAQNFPRDGYTLKIDGFPGGCVVETDLPVRALRSLFRVAGVRWRDYVTDTTPTWEQTDERGEGEQAVEAGAPSAL